MIVPSPSPSFSLSIALVFALFRRGILPVSSDVGRTISYDSRPGETGNTLEERKSGPRRIPSDFTTSPSRPLNLIVTQWPYLAEMFSGPSARLENRIARGNSARASDSAAAFPSVVFPDYERRARGGEQSSRVCQETFCSGYAPVERYSLLLPVLLGAHCHQRQARKQSFSIHFELEIVPTTMGKKFGRRMCFSVSPRDLDELKTILFFGVSSHLRKTSRNFTREHFLPVE